MNKSLTIFLICVSLLFSACASNQFSEYKKQGSSRLYELPLRSGFDGGYSTLLYKAQITFRDNNFGGLFFVKKIHQDTIRFVMLSEMGLKLLDFGFESRNFIVYFAIEQMQNSIALNALQSDFRLLLLYFSNQKADILQAPDGSIAYKFKTVDTRTDFDSETSDLYVFADADGYPLKMIKTDRWKEKALYTFSGGAPPDTVTIIHHSYGLQINMLLVEKK